MNNYTTMKRCTHKGTLYKKLDKDFNGHDEDGGGPCHTHLLAKGRVRGFVVGLFGEVSSDTLTLVRHCVDMIAYRV